MNCSLFGASYDKSAQYDFLCEKENGGWVKFEFNWYLKAVTEVESRMTRGRSFHSRSADGKKELTVVC